MTENASSLTPTPEPVTIDPVQDKAASIADTTTALQSMLAELEVIAKDPTRTFTGIAGLASAAALPDFQRDNKAIDDFLQEFQALADAVKGEEEAAWRATVAAKQVLTLPTFQDMVNKYSVKV